MIRYKIALINVFWSKDDINTRYFDDVATQKTYFDSLIGSNFSAPLNFNMNDNIETIVTYKDESGRDAETLCKTNYAVVIKGDYNKETEVFTEQSRRYYFSYATQDSNGQMRCQLSLDDIQTNYFNYKDKIQTCLINKAHLDRWQDPSSSTIQFDYRNSSDLFANEEIRTIAKRLKTRSKMIYYSDKSENAQLVEFLNNYIVGWVYVLINENHTYKYLDKSGTNKNGTFSNTMIDERSAYISGSETHYKPDLISPFTTLCFPIYEDEFCSLNIRDSASSSGSKICVCSDGYYQFLRDNNDYSYVHSVKISMKPPFNLNQKLRYVVSGKQLMFINETTADENYLELYGGVLIDNLGFIFRTKVGTGVNNDYFGLFCMTNDYSDPVLFKTNLTMPSISFSKSSIVGSVRNINWNPKLNGQEYKNLIISFCGNSQEFPIDKINSEDPVFAYYENISLDASKILIKLWTYGNNNIYNYDYVKSYNGLAITNDLSIPIANNQLELYLANNKNAYLSFLNQQNLKSANFVADTISVSGDLLNPFKAGKTATSIASNALKTAISISYDSAQFSLSLDNMKNAPESLNSLNGNSYFLYIVSKIGGKFGLYAEIYEGISTDMKVVDDLMYRNGYNYGKIGKVSDFDNLRKKFNFISANVELITANISDKEKERLRDRLKSVRFWNQDTIDYINENYERSLE